MMDSEPQAGPMVQIILARRVEPEMATPFNEAADFSETKSGSLSFKAPSMKF